MKISVCIATYNGDKFICEQLDSILFQLKENDEVIISDDSSTDHTVAEINKFGDQRIKVFTNPKKNGVIHNFENAIKQSSGDLIFLADQDDIWKPNKVSVFMKSFTEGFNLILSDCETFDTQTGEIVNSSFFAFANSKKGIISNILSNSYIGCCMAFDKKVKDKILPFPKKLPMHDSWIGIIGEYFFKVKFEHQVLLKYRLHANNASYTGQGKSKYSIGKKISFRYYLVKNLISKFLFK